MKKLNERFDMIRCPQKKMFDLNRFVDTPLKSMDTFVLHKILKINYLQTYLKCHFI